MRDHQHAASPRRSRKRGRNIEDDTCGEVGGGPTCGAVAPEKRFALADILNGGTDFFICLPPDVLDAMPQVPRILIGALAMAFARQNSRAVHETLFIVDEMPRLGRLQALATARDIARKYGLYVWAIVQDLGQLEE